MSLTATAKEKSKKICERRGGRVILGILEKHCTNIKLKRNGGAAQLWGIFLGA